MIVDNLVQVAVDSSLAANIERLTRRRETKLTSFDETRETYDQYNKDKRCHFQHFGELKI